MSVHQHFSITSIFKTYPHDFLGRPNRLSDLPRRLLSIPKWVFEGPRATKRSQFLTLVRVDFNGVQHRYYLSMRIWLHVYIYINIYIYIYFNISIWKSMNPHAIPRLSAGASFFPKVLTSPMAAMRTAPCCGKVADQAFFGHGDDDKIWVWTIPKWGLGWSEPPFSGDIIVNIEV